jgi:virulence-associated protein VagC
MEILTKIMEYEQKVFSKYTTMRSQMLKQLNEVNINTLSKDQILILINDVKAVIEPINSSTENIRHLVDNTNSQFSNKESLENTKIFKRLLTYFLLDDLLTTGSGSESDSVSEPDTESERSELDSRSSESVSELESESV